jgi:hypothetical protein
MNKLEELNQESLIYFCTYHKCGRTLIFFLLLNIGGRQGHKSMVHATYYDSMSSTVVAAGDCSETLLSSCVPLQSQLPDIFSS